ncbi:MAG: DUF393 domain-containing protein, partial [Candidatus Omnitrophica bacterium]|nr:DUF393 domain-containing protein [Candidatus Omnitrophota bacterium]
MLSKTFHKLFLIERPSISLSLFRLAVAVTTGFHVLPTFFHLHDNYFHTAFKTHNANFFPIWFLELVAKSPEWLIVVFVFLFCFSWFAFLVGLFSQLSCIVMVFSCYYFYALNAFHVGTLSWDILLVTLFLMCVTNYHSDYFSLDSLKRGDVYAYRRKRPYFIQRLLQMQIGFTFFYTALYKITGEGNWFKDNPIYYIMNYPSAGTTKYFLLRDFLREQPQLCYWIGIGVVVVEFLMIFLLFCRKTRVSAIYLGCLFHITLILTLDVPAIFFFLFPAQLFLFINPDIIVDWIEAKRQEQKGAGRPVLLYDGQCQFCQVNIILLKIMDLFAVFDYQDFHSVGDLKQLHPDLTQEKAKTQLHLISQRGQLYGGFQAVRQMAFNLPMMWPGL